MNKNDKVWLSEILKMKLGLASVEQMKLYTDTQFCESANCALGPCCVYSVLFADEFPDEFAHEFASKFVIKLF